MTTQQACIRRRAYAKVNLALAVGPAVRGPGALHPIASWMHAIDLFDEVEIRPGKPGLDIRWAADALRATPIDWPPERDLCVRAVEALARHAGRTLDASIRITKRIPVGGGLGGGSSDAAAALLGANACFGLGRTADELAHVSREIGSDVAFFLDERAGRDTPARPAIVTGMGEQIERESPAAAWLVLIVPPFGISTGAVYGRFDELAARALREDAVRALATRPLGPETALFNDLGGPAEAVEPRLADLRSRCTLLLGCAVHITGSGSTMFAVAEDGAAAATMANAVRVAIPELAALAVRLV